MTEQLKRGIDPNNVKVALKLSVVKPPHAKWVIKPYKKLKNQTDIIVSGFVSFGIIGAIEEASIVVARVKTPLREINEDANGGIR